MNLKSLSNQELHIQTVSAAKKEQEMTLFVLEHLKEVDARMLWAIKTRSSLWEYVAIDLGYSGPGASERVGALRLMNAIPEVKMEIQNGNFNLTNASRLQRYIQAKEADTRAALPLAKKKALFQSCLAKSTREVDRLLVGESPDLALRKEKQRPISKTLTELKFTVDEDTMQMVERLKELKGDYLGPRCSSLL